MNQALPVVNYYQVSLKNEGEELMTSPIFYDDNSLNKFLSKLNLITNNYEIKNITVNPKIDDLSYKLDKNYDVTNSRYCFYNEDEENNDFNTNPETDFNTNPETDFNTNPDTTSNLWINPSFQESQIHYSNNLVDDDSYHNLQGMNVYSYGDGYMLKPLLNDSRFGKDFFDFGRWNDEQEAWFINSNLLDYVLECGAILKVNNCLEYDQNCDEYLFCNMEFEDFDDGYILSFSKNQDKSVKVNFNISNFSLYEELWYEQGQGWLFTKTDKDFLEYNGAIYKDNSCNLFENMKFIESGEKGYKLIAEKNNKFYGLENFLGLGKWRKDYWFFKKDELVNYDFFINKGCIYSA